MLLNSVKMPLQKNHEQSRSGFLNPNSHPTVVSAAQGLQLLLQRLMHMLHAP